MKKLNVEQARAQLSELIGKVHGGEEIVIVADGGNAVRLVPVVAARGRPRFGSARGLFTMRDDFDALS